MLKEIIKDFFIKIKSGDLEKKQKICLSASIGWVLFIGYLTWWNGIKAVGLDKSFKWDEWFWFGIIPATMPYVFYLIWRKKNQINQFNFFLRLPSIVSKN